MRLRASLYELLPSSPGSGCGPAASPVEVVESWEETKDNFPAQDLVKPNYPDPCPPLLHLHGLVPLVFLEPAPPRAITGLNQVLPNF